MIVRHIVMWNVRGARGSSEHRENLNLLKVAFEGLADRIPGLLKIEVGIDFSAVEYACDAVLLSEFDGPESLHAYMKHPAHEEAKLLVGDIRTMRHQVDFISE